ncbi:MAG: adenylate/guanylate cyclase domain-containing protein [Nitrospinae bacterium]|nr:adenylate/guanylate cyclase domain-containing protein [Nitrospinota bacterium]
MRKKWLNSFTISLGLTLVSLYVYSLDLPFFQALELKSYDYKVRARGSRPPSGTIAIVAIDEKSLKEHGRWPWPRTVLADLLDRLSEAEVKTIGFDIFFPEKDGYVPFASFKRAIREKDLRGVSRENLLQWLDETGDSDRRFAASIERSGRVVLGYFVYPLEDKAGVSAQKAGEKQFELLDSSQYSIVQRFDSPGQPAALRRIHMVGMNLPEFMRSANAAGFVSFIPEIDGVVRWVPLVQEFQKTLFPPLSLQLVQQATGLSLAVRIAPYGVAGVMVGDMAVPTAENGDFLINYYGPAYTFTHYPATDVLSGKVGARELKDKIVLVGGSAAGTHDIHTSPYGPLFSGVEIHANIMENLLQGDFLRRPEWFRVLDLGVIAISGLLLGAVSAYFKAITMAVLLTVAIAGYISFDYYIFAKMGLWINSVYSVLNLVFVFTGIVIYRFAFEEREKRFIKSAFGQYLAPAVVEQVVNDPSLLKLGGERKILTAFFSDIAGFSSISEKLSPEALVDLLNVYLTEMTDIILKYEGTVDKFVGDAIVAFFGAPIPCEDHARRACLASMEMQARLGVLRERWKSEGKPEIFARVGLNTGPMIIGNMGSKTRMDYTIMGDAVNLASRLEGVNKQYGTYIMISEFTYEQARDFIDARELDWIRVVGKNEPIKIYEVLGGKGEIAGPMRNALPIFDKGLQHYRRMEWDSAMACFGKVLEIRETDGPASAFSRRCMLFKKDPPPDGWGGIFSMTSK